MNYSERGDKITMEPIKRTGPETGSIKPNKMDDNLKSTKKLSESMVDHPFHYNHGNIEAIEVIQDWDLSFCLGSALKYICRAGHKDNDIEDLEKAKRYIEFELENRRKNNV